MARCQPKRGACAQECSRFKGKRLGRPRIEVDQARLNSVMRRGLSVRDSARLLGISPSSYARLLRAHLAEGDLVAVSELTPAKATVSGTASPVAW